MTDKDLADRAVALGIGVSMLTNNGEIYGLEIAEFSGEKFTQSWDVAGAAMKKLKGAEEMGKIKGTDVQHIFSTLISAGKIGDPHATLSACVQLLEKE